MQTRNKSICCTTLHTLLHLGQISDQITCHFVEDKSKLKKLMKTGDRIFWMDYGTNLDREMTLKIIEPLPAGLHILVFPTVVEGIDWKMFAQKTLQGSSENAEQRGLSFDTTVGKKLGPGLYECEQTAARVWLMDSKLVSKKTNDFSFETFKQSGVKIGVMSEANIICHYTHECIGNILETSGITLEN